MPKQRSPQAAAWITLDRVQSLMSRQLQATMTEHDITRPQYSVLRLLFEDGPQTANALSVAMGVTPGNLTGVIDRLEAAGLVQRQRDAADRRAVLVSLSESGERKARAAIPSVRGQLKRLFAALDDAELAVFQGSLNRLESALGAEERAEQAAQTVSAQTGAVAS